MNVKRQNQQDSWRWRRLLLNLTHSWEWNVKKILFFSSISFQTLLWQEDYLRFVAFYFVRICNINITFLQPLKFLMTRNPLWILLVNIQMWKLYCQTNWEFEIILTVLRVFIKYMRYLRSTRGRYLQKQTAHTQVCRPGWDDDETQKIWENSKLSWEPRKYLNSKIKLSRNLQGRRALESGK